MRLKDENKRKAILQASVQIFAKAGFHNAKIAGIAEKAGVAAGSIYSYFETKEDILLSLFDDIWESLYRKGQTIAENSALTASEKLTALIDCVFSLFLEDRKLALVFAHEQQGMMRRYPKRFTGRYNDFLEIGEKVLSHGKHEGFVAAPVQIAIFRSFIMGGIRALLQNWADDPKNYPLADIQKQIPLFVSGIFRK